MGQGKCLRPLTRWLGGLKKGQKYAYVIFEWSLISNDDFSMLYRGVISSKAGKVVALPKFSDILTLSQSAQGSD